MPAPPRSGFSYKTRGKTLIQVVDNGKGMSDTDARMAFERHATSKIRNIDDLFHIKTMFLRRFWFIAVAQVEPRTRQRKTKWVPVSRLRRTAASSSRNR